MNSFEDVLSNTLSSLRISGSLLLREAYKPPWGVAIPSGDRLRKLLGVKSGARVVAFHLVEAGSCNIKLENGDGATISAGEMAVCFGGAAHQISQGENPPILPVESLLANAGNGNPPNESDGERNTSLMCGVFLLHDTLFNPLIAALPPLLHASMSRPGEFHNLSGVARLMAQEIDRKSFGSGYMVERLVEVLCAEAIRAHIEATPGQDVNWLNGIKDPIVGRAIAAIHSNPGDNWSVKRLAEGVIMSPSRFAARFTSSLGDSPMAYIAKWRMNVACRLLIGTEQGVGQIASNVGYESMAAFNRAFKKHVGLPPAAWRAQALRISPVGAVI